MQKVELPDNTIDSNAVADNQPDKKETKTRKVRKSLDENMLVPVRSNVSGKLIYKSPTGVDIRLSNIGDEDVITLRDLRSLISSKRSYIEKGWLLILDEEVVDYLNVARVQKNVVDAEDVDHILQLSPDKIQEVIKEANTNTKSLLFSFAQKRFLDGSLSDYHVIKAIEEGLNLSLDPNN